jgi:hypothetical protein
MREVYWIVKCFLFGYPSPICSKGEFNAVSNGHKISHEEEFILPINNKRVNTQMK